MNTKPHDLPFHQDNSPKMIPWIIGLMVYLATLSLAGSIVLSSIITSWDRGFKNGFSVELSPPEGIDAEVMGGEILRQKKVLYILSKIPSVKRTQVIAKTTVSSSTESLINTEEENIGLPLPTIIDVELKKNSSVDLNMLQTNLERIMPGVNIIHDREWRKGLKSVANIFLSISVIVAGLIGFVTFAIAAFTTHTGLVIYSKIIEVLHLVGANNHYIAEQFQSHSFKLGLRSGLIGFAFSLMTLGLTYWIASSLSLPEFMKGIPIIDLAVLSIVIPMVVTLIMMLTARLTVLWELRSKS